MSHSTANDFDKKINDYDKIISKQLGEELKSYKYIYEENDRLKGLVSSAANGLRVYIEITEAILDDLKKGARKLTSAEQEELEEKTSDLISSFTLMKSAYQTHLRLNCLNVHEEIKSMLPAIKHLRKLAKELGLREERTNLKELANDEDLTEHELRELEKAGRDLFHTAESINRLDGIDLEDHDEIEDALKIAKENLISIRSNYKIITELLVRIGTHLKEALSVGGKVTGEDKELHDLLEKYVKENPDDTTKRSKAAEDVKNYLQRTLAHA